MIHARMHQHTAIYPDKAPGLPVDKAQGAFRPDGKPGMVPIPVLLGRRHHREHRRVFQSAHSAQGVPDAVLFDGKLSLIGYVLPLAAGTLPVVGAGGLHPVGGCLPQLHHPGGDILATHPEHLGNYLLSGDAAEHKHLSALVVSQSIAQPAPAFQGQEKKLAWCYSFLGTLLVQTNPLGIL
jgi:hypothetical protein